MTGGRTLPCEEWNPSQRLRHRQLQESPVGRFRPCCAANLRTASAPANRVLLLKGLALL